MGAPILGPVPGYPPFLIPWRLDAYNLTAGSYTGGAPTVRLQTSQAVQLDDGPARLVDNTLTWTPDQAREFAGHVLALADEYDPQPPKLPELSSLAPEMFDYIDSRIGDEQTVDRSVPVTRPERWALQFTLADGRLRRIAFLTLDDLNMIDKLIDWQEPVYLYGNGEDIPTASTPDMPAVHFGDLSDRILTMIGAGMDSTVPAADAATRLLDARRATRPARKVTDSPQA